MKGGYWGGGGQPGWQSSRIKMRQWKRNGKVGINYLLESIKIDDKDEEDMGEKEKKKKDPNYPFLQQRIKQQKNLSKSKS